MGRTCIICRKEKDTHLFNLEHIFPASIGGKLTTTNVCQNCNTLLNQKIDEPFVKSNFVLLHRHILNLNRDTKRKIQNLLKSPVKNAEGDLAILGVKDGNVTSEILDKFSYSVDENGKIICSLTIDGSKIKQKDEIIRTYLQRLNKKLGINKPIEYLLLSEEKNEKKEFVITVNAENNLLIKQCAKIAYEMACLTAPNYVEDEYSKKLLDLLLNDLISRDIFEIDQIAIGQYSKYKERISKLNIQPHQHAILIDNVENEGVYCTVKIFQYLYTLLLTRKTDVFPKEEYLLINDSVNGSLSSNHLLNYKFINCRIEVDNKAEQDKKNIDKLGLSYFQEINNSWVLYGANRKIKYPNINSLCISVIKSDNLYKDSKTGYITLDLKNKHIYIKSTENTLAKLVNLTVEEEILIQALPH